MEKETLEEAKALENGIEYLKNQIDGLEDMQKVISIGVEGENYRETIQDGIEEDFLFSIKEIILAYLKVTLESMENRLESL